MQTLTEQTFAAACSRLAARVEASGFRPDLIIGIATGGDYVAARLHAAFPAAGLLSVRCQRPSTPAKERLARLIRLLPRPVANLLRFIEHYARILADRLHRDKPIAPTVPAAGQEFSRILIADDAVDSGKTLAAVSEAVSKAYPQAEIRTAAITMTRRHPAVRPDYFLTTQLTRFPWSLDA